MAFYSLCRIVLLYLRFLHAWEVQVCEAIISKDASATPESHPYAKAFFLQENL